MSLMVVHTCILANGMGLENARLGRYTVDMHGPIAGLRRDILVEWIPSHALNIVVVFSYLMYTLACGSYQFGKPLNVDN
jgi:hypothetical protein